MRKTLQLLILFVAALALWACGGSGSSSGGSQSQLGSFHFKVSWPSSREVPPATAKYTVQLRHDGSIVGSTDVVAPATEGTINDIPSGDTTADVYAYDVDNNLLASGGADFFIKPGTVTSQSVTVQDVPPPVEDDQFIIGGSVGPVDGQPGVLQITLPALIHLSDGSPALGLTDQNFMVFEDNIRKEPITVTSGEGTTSKADIAVVLDTTGSMSGAISSVQDSVKAFADAVAAKGVDVRFAGIEFGDDMRTQIDFTSDVDSFKTWVSGLYAYGGNDTPENPLDAIMLMANKTNWRPDAQPIILVITDAPAHSADDITSQTVDSVIAALRGRFVVHAVCPGDAGAKPSRSNGGNQVQPRGVTNEEYINRVATETGGVWTPFPYDGYNVDLTTLPIASTLSQGYLITFNSHQYNVDHDIRLVVHDGSNLLADQVFHGHYGPKKK